MVSESSYKRPGLVWNWGIVVAVVIGLIYMNNPTCLVWVPLGTEQALLGSALIPNVGLPATNPDLVGLQCRYWTLDGKPKKMRWPITSKFLTNGSSKWLKLLNVHLKTEREFLCMLFFWIVGNMLIFRLSIDVYSSPPCVVLIQLITFSAVFSSL